MGRHKLVPVPAWQCVDCGEIAPAQWRHEFEKEDCYGVPPGEPPLVAGGQGRSGSQIVTAAVVVVACAVLALVLILFCI